MGETTHGLRLARTCLFVSVPAAYGVLALALGMDANWDLRNYHYYNAYAFLSGRLGFDLLLAHVPTFFNPTIDVPFFLAAEAWPARVVGFLLGAAQGLNVIPLFGIAYALLRLEARWRIGTAAGLALLGVTGVGALSLVGTTFYDNVVSLGPLLGLWLVVARLRAGEAAPVGPVVALAAGAIAGLAVGLKPTVAPFALGLSAGMLVLSGSPWRRASLALSCGAGVLLGAASADPDALRSALGDEAAERLLLSLLFQDPPVEEKDRERVVNDAVDYLVHRQRAAGRFDALYRAISAAQAAGDVEQVRRLQTEYEELIGMLHPSRKGGDDDG